MYYSTSIAYIIILSPLILLALLATIGIVLYRHAVENYRENGIAYHLRKEKELNK